MSATHGGQDDLASGNGLGQDGDRHDAAALSLTALPPQEHHLYNVAMSSGAPSLASNEASRLVNHLIRMRRLRDSLFPSGLFADPAWDILLDLYRAELIDRPVTVSNAAIAAAVPATTALRYIDQLTQMGLAERVRDARDGRRIYLRLTPAAVQALHGWMAKM